MHNRAGGRLGLSTRQAAMIWLTAVACLLVVIGIDPAISDIGATIGLGLALGGATGNFADRLVRGAVVDFVALGRWPAFNVADAAMVVGTILAVWGLL